MNYPTPQKTKNKTIPLQWEEDQKGARNVENHSKQAMEQQEKTKQSKNIALGANPGVCSTGAQDQTVQEVDHMESGSVTTVQEAGRMESGTADTGPGPVAKQQQRRRRLGRWLERRIRRGKTRRDGSHRRLIS